VTVDIQGYDLNPQMVQYAKKNAQDAGVEDKIHFQVRDVADLSHRGKYGFLVTNPPYGERLEEKEALPALYKTIGQRFLGLDKWSAFIITSYKDIERDMGIKATKNRKIYNGMIQTYFYQFMGPKPPKKNV
jgi:putative N6-adenine-specific DNA methylase